MSAQHVIEKGSFFIIANVPRYVYVQNGNPVPATIASGPTFPLLIDKLCMSRVRDKWWPHLSFTFSIYTPPHISKLFLHFPACIFSQNNTKSTQGAEPACIHECPVSMTLLWVVHLSIFIPRTMIELMEPAWVLKKQWRASHIRPPVYPWTFRQAYKICNDAENETIILFYHAFPSCFLPR